MMIISEYIITWQSLLKKVVHRYGEFELREPIFPRLGKKLKSIGKIVISMFSRRSVSLVGGLKAYGK